MMAVGQYFWLPAYVCLLVFSQPSGVCFHPRHRVYLPICPSSCRVSDLPTLAVRPSCRPAWPPPCAYQLYGRPIRCLYDASTADTKLLSSARYRVYVNVWLPYIFINSRRVWVFSGARSSLLVGGKMEPVRSGGMQARNQDFVWVSAFCFKVDRTIIVMIKECDWAYRVNTVVKGVVQD